MKNSYVAAIATVCVLAVLFASFAVYEDSGTESSDFILIHTNDTHCYYDNEKGLGFPTVKALKDKYVAEGNATFLVDAGDFIQGNAYGTLTMGEASIEVMNTVGYDVGVPGNHEFDYTFEVMLENTSKLNYPIICSNLIYKTTGESVYPESLVIEKKGVRIGFFGLLTPDTERDSKAGCMGDAEVTDPSKAAERMVNILKGEDVDCIVAISHLGVSRSDSVTSDQVCSKVDGIDIMVDGHSHTEMEDGKVCDGSIDLIPSDTVIVSTGCYNKNVGVVTVTDEDDVSAKLYRGEKLHDPAVDAAIKKVTEDLDELLKQKVGHTDIYLDGRRETVRVNETNLGDLVADSMRKAAESDIALINGGSVRTSVEIGDIILKNIYDINPFLNTLMFFEITGKELKEEMEFSYSKYGEEFGGFLQVSGIVVKYDTTKDVGSRIVSIEFDGKEVKDDEVFTVVTTDFIATGGDGNEIFLGKTGKVIGELLTCIVDYLKDVGNVTESTVQMDRLIPLLS
jgi:5'-nucleotidase